MPGLSKRYESSHADLDALRFASSPEVLSFFDIVLLCSKKIRCIGSMEEKNNSTSCQDRAISHAWNAETSHAVNRYFTNHKLKD